MTENQLSRAIIGSCIEIHKEIGPGLLESVYEEALSYELTDLGYHVDRQKAIPMIYKNVKMEIGFRADLIAENKVLIEIKSIVAIAKVHPKVVLTYLKLTGLKLGLLINFTEILLKNGITRIVNKLQE